jgi:pyridoxine 4-dehydrogenase
MRVRRPRLPSLGTDRDGRAAALVRHAGGRRQARATPNQIALAWLLHRSPAILPIPGTGSLEHLRENVGAASIELSEDELADLP